MLSLQLLVDMVTGQLGDQGEQSGAAAISRVLLAGNLLSQTTQDKEASTKVRRGPVRGDQGSTHMDFFFRANTDFLFFHQSSPMADSDFPPPTIVSYAINLCTYCM